MSVQQAHGLTAEVSGEEHTAEAADYQQVKSRVHARLLNRLDLDRLDGMTRGAAEPEMRPLILSLLEDDAETSGPLSLLERQHIVDEVLDEIFGLGPLEPLLLDESISDILVNGYNQVYIERNGILEETNIAFRDDKHLRRIIDRIVSSVGRRVDESSAMVDARLADGSRVNAIIPPLSPDGPILSIRRFPSHRLNAADLVARGTLMQSMLDFLAAAVAARLNIIVCGGTGSGKTTLLNVLSSFISGKERIVTIEDACELKLQQRHVVRLETRMPNIEGKGAVHQRQLLINALRMRPDRIVMGEVRGEEALDMLQAMNTGHDGSLSTIHANTPRDALYRLDTMVAMANLNLGEKAVRQQIASSINLLVEVTRLSDGTRRVTAISELAGIEGDVILLQDLFVFEKQGVTPEGHIVGQFKATGIRPKCADRLAATGHPLLPELFTGLQAA